MINFSESSFKNNLKIKLKNQLAYWFTKSYSQEGEDLILNRIFEHQAKGFFVDVGAHHPMRFSNTYLFYKKGWRGINIDAAPGSMDEFNNHRSEDINIETPVSDTSEELDYFMFNDGALNTLDKDRAQEIAASSNGRYQIINNVKLKTKTLASILNENMPENTPIDFMSIDVEGMDIKVLKSNDWNKFAPTYLLVEDEYSKIQEILDSHISTFLKGHGYNLMYKTVATCIYKRSKEN